MEAKTTEWRPGPTVCRCCLTEGCYKDISTEYFWMGKREVYAEMLLETFDLNISYSQSGGPNSNSRLICEPCISRLRDAADFKRQVVECERSFTQFLDPVAMADVDVNLELGKEVKLEHVKDEKTLSEEEDDEFVPPDFGDGDDDDDDDLDDQPLTKLASKIPKKESVDVLDLLDNAKMTEKRKSSSKSKSSPAKKTKLKKDMASSSKVKPEPRKKKVTDAASSMQVAKRNAQLVLQYSTAYPFRTRGNFMLCVYCCEEYADPKDYRAHMDALHKSFTISTAFAHIGRSKEYLKVDLSDLKCRLCSTPCNSLEEIAVHIRNVHHINKIDTNFDIGMHPYRVDSDRWVCFLCDKKMASLTKLCRHTTCHYQKYTCDVCGRSYLTYEALKYHIRCSHSGKYVCRKCWTDFPTLEKKREHVRNSKPCWASICLSCGERFMSWESKQRHLVDVHGVPKKVFACPECEQTYDSRKHFYNHFKLNHSDDSYVCSCCGLKFTTKLRMEEHRASHTGEKPYQCNICMKTFSRSKGLKQHMWIHSENKRFVCMICDKQFSQKVSLKGHLISHHPEATEETHWKYADVGRMRVRKRK